MKLAIKPLTSDLISDYLDYFDNRAFSSTDKNGPCYCTCPTQTSKEIDQMVKEFSGDIKAIIRSYAIKMLNENKIHGYLAYDNDIVVGWCNAGNMDNYVKNRYQFIPDFARNRSIGKIMSVVCFSVSPQYRGSGVSTLLLEKVILDASKQGYEAVEGYTHVKKGQYDMDFKGPMKLYEKLGFIPSYEQDGILIMRKNL
ncbi:MAG: GNAT family N-acetyltransferase [Bacilli bacterium]|nr:GNAT family N-acetyltransferase [Bacilli bacterium]